MKTFNVTPTYHRQLLGKFPYQIMISQEIVSNSLEDRDPITKASYRYIWCLDKFGKPTLSSPWYYWTHKLLSERHHHYGFKFQEDAIEFKLRFIY